MRRATASSRASSSCRSAATSTASAPVFALVSTARRLARGELQGRPARRTCASARTATVKVDSYPGKTFKGRVVSVSPGTGSQFSMLPPENATGNWVKVVQRLPVRVELEQTRPGVSAACRPERDRDVDTRYQRHLFGVDRAAHRDDDATRPRADERRRTPQARAAGGAASGPHHALGDAGLDHAGARQHDRQRRAAAHPGHRCRRRRIR